MGEAKLLIFNLNTWNSGVYLGIQNIKIQSILFHKQDQGFLNFVITSNIN